jgi:hypothetical protein
VSLGRIGEKRMPVKILDLVEELEPSTSVLFLGAGSSVPSGAPAGGTIKKTLAEHFSISGGNDLTLGEVSTLIERRYGRPKLINAIRSSLTELSPTRGLLELPNYDWKAIYTTNYDLLVEKCYERSHRPLEVYASNFDFTERARPSTAKLFKLHGSVDRDIVDGYNARIVITDSDYEQVNDYREALFDRMRSDLNEATLLVVGNSLSDSHLRDLISRAGTIASSCANKPRISVLCYEENLDRAELLEAKKFRVCFGGIDEFFAALGRSKGKRRSSPKTGDPLDAEPGLHAVTYDVGHSKAASADVSSMYNGWPADYSNIKANQTFDRTLAADLEELFTRSEIPTAVVLGAAGVGKTTAARQALVRLQAKGFRCWEHQTDHPIGVPDWMSVAKSLRDSGERGVLLIDEAHQHLFSLNDLVDRLEAEKCRNLRLLMVSTRHKWSPRIKTPNINRLGKVFQLSRLDGDEIERLIELVESVPELKTLVERTFRGFSRYEARRRLVERCEADMFVCLKNIFASDSFDDIILREYANLDPNLQDIYRHVAALEHAGVRVHRQLAIRLLGISPEAIGHVLEQLTGIISEYDISPSEGIYGWRGRHPVIHEIISRFKFADLEKKAELFGRYVDSVSPTYNVEIRSVREFCHSMTGLRVLPDKYEQNTLLRRLISSVPGERVPRHRLIRNLIELGEFEKAETEIRIFEGDFRADGPVTSYKVDLLRERAKAVAGIQESDRVVILNEARAIAVNGVKRFRISKGLLRAYAELGIEYFKMTGDYGVFDEGMAAIAVAEEESGDPDLSRMKGRFHAKIRSGSTASSDDEEDPE